MYILYRLHCSNNKRSEYRCVGISKAPFNRVLSRNSRANRSADSLCCVGRGVGNGYTQYMMHGAVSRITRNNLHGYGP